MGSTLLELVNRILRRARWPAVTTLEGDSIPLDIYKVVELVNVVARAMARKQAYPFLRKTFRIPTVATYTTGNVIAANGSARVAGILSLWPQAIVGRLITITGYDEVHRILETSFGQLLTLDQPFTGTSHSSPTAYTIGQDCYLLPEDFDRPFDDVTQAKANPHRLRSIPLDEIHHAQAESIVYSTPTKYALQETPEGKKYAILDPVPEEVGYVNIDYLVTIPVVQNNLDKLPLPLRVEDTLVDGVLAVLKRDQQNDLQAAQLTIQDYLGSLIDSNRPVSTSPRMTITPDTSHRQIQDIKYGRSGRVDFGDLWDKML
jgi:hypothetical protein